MPTHKVQSYRTGHYSVTLPKLWAEELGMMTGKPVQITKDGKKLIIKRS